MPGDSETRDIKHSTARRRQAVLDRISAALDDVDRENRALRTQVSEYQGALVDLRTGFENIVDASDRGDLEQLRLSLNDTARLRRAADRIGMVADIWSERAGRRDSPKSA